MFSREGSSCNNNRRLTGDMQQAKSFRGTTWREYTVFFGWIQITLLIQKLKTFEAVAWPPPRARKPRNNAQFIAIALPFYHRQICEISFMRRKAFVLALEHPSGTKFVNFPQVQRFLVKQATSHRFVGLLLQSLTGNESGSMGLLPCFCVFALQIFKRFFNRNF